MRFEHPPFLWLLLPALAVLGAFLLWSWRTRRRLIAQFVSARLLPTLLQDAAPGRLQLRLWLLLGAVGLLLLALSRPQLGFSYEEVRSRGLDIVVAIDTSRSMLATDIAPNRLRRAQLAALDLKRIARADRVGLVAFAGGAFLQCPLTLDDEAFRQSVEALDVSVIPQGGTALAEAIQSALGAFKEGNDNHKVLVLFTDGEDHDGQALETAKTAAGQGLRLFTVGVGTPNGDVLRMVDASGRSEFIKGPDGNAVRSKLNEALLRELASVTGGFYLQLSGAGTVSMLYERGLQPLPRSEQAAQRVRRYHERYQWLLAAAILLLLAEMFVPERRPAPRPAARTPSARTVAGVLACLLALPLSTAAGPAGARKQYEAGQYEASRKQYEALLKSRREDPRLHFNAGTAALGEGDFEAATDHLNAALTSPDLQLQQRAYYNLGHARYRLGQDAAAPDKKQEQWQEAVKQFESALKLDPADADAQHNLEFVRKQLEELKQQQQQQQQQNDPKDQKDRKDEKNQEKNEPKQDPQKQDQQQQQKDSSKKDESQKQDSAKPDEQKDKEQQGKPEDKKEEPKRGQQAQPQEKEKDKDQGNPAEPEGAPQTATLRMKPEDAIRLLETLKADEKNMPFRPILRTNRQERVFKDW